MRKGPKDGERETKRDKHINRERARETEREWIVVPLFDFISLERLMLQVSLGKENIWNDDGVLWLLISVRNELCILLWIPSLSPPSLSLLLLSPAFKLFLSIAKKAVSLFLSHSILFSLSSIFLFNSLFYVPFLTLSENLSSLLLPFSCLFFFRQRKVDKGART